MTLEEKCSHCTGVLEAHQMVHSKGCLCKCHASLTAEQRAEKIVGKLEYRTERLINQYEVEMIAAEIRTAINDALELMAWGNLEREAKAEAYEDAAKIAEACKQAAGLSMMGPLTACDLIAERIRARAKALTDNVRGELK